MKRCRKCGADKSLDEFHKDQRNPDGHHYYCRTCRNDAARPKTRQWHLDNPEQSKSNCKRWKANHPERVRELWRKFKRLNPEKVKEYQRKYLERKRRERLEDTTGGSE